MYSDRDPLSEESSSDEEEEDYEELTFNTNLQMIGGNDPLATRLQGRGSYERVQNMTDEGWEQLGRDMSNIRHLEAVCLSEGALNDHKMRYFFRGLTGSKTIKYMDLCKNGLSAAGIRSMVPFLQTNSLLRLYLDDNNIEFEGFNVLSQALRGSPIEYLSCCSNNLQSEGFNNLLRELRDSPIMHLFCTNCDIESIEIDNDYFPKHLSRLRLRGNKISTEGCRGLAKLLQREDSTLTQLHLQNNKIDDDGVEILVNALQNNTSLADLSLKGNNEISIEGMKACLRLVNDISGIKATLQSNHTMRYLDVKEAYGLLTPVVKVQLQISDSLEINHDYEDDLEVVGKEKVIQTQLNSGKRAELADLLGVTRSLYIDINPLHLPEVLALVGQHHGQEELYVALKSSIAGVISTVNRKTCIQQRRAYLVAELAELDAELEAINESERDVVGIESEESRSRKRRRK